jgi:UDP:flavonoid glycosyltransferase YjiC (YdhE family)
VLTGPELDPSEVPARPGVYVESYVPHAIVLPQAAVVVSHAGMGSLLEAFRAGVPSVCIPLGRDQAGNAAAAIERGAAITLPADATSDQIRTAITEALTSPALRSGTRHMASALAACGGAAAAADEVERTARRDATLASASTLCVPRTPSTSCGQVIFVDQATDASLSSDAVLVAIDRLG